jgi:hypothetical protein
MNGKISGWFPHDKSWVIVPEGCTDGSLSVYADEDALPADAKGLLVSFDLEPGRGAFRAINVTTRDE